MLRRRPFLAALFLLLLLLALTVGIFLYTFDLDHYRDEVQTRLTAGIGRPVTLGNAHLSLRNGLALTFSTITIPATAEQSWALEAGSLLAKVPLSALLGGKTEFSEIVLANPRLRFILRQDLPPASFRMPDWDRFGIRLLSIRAGSVTVEDRRGTPRPLNLQMDKINLRLHDFAVGQRAWLTLAGQIRQGGTAAAVDLAGDIVPADDLRQSAVNLALKVDGLDAAVLARHLPKVESLAGTVSAALNLTGTPAAGLKLAGEINGAKLTAAIPDYYDEPLSISRLHLAGAWTGENGTQRLTDVSLQVDALAASGSFLWRWENDALWLDARLATPSQPLAVLAQVLPTHGAAAGWKERLLGGHWQIENLHYAGPARDLAGMERGLPLAGKVHVKDLRWLGADARLGGVSFAAAIADDRLQFDGGTEFLQAPLRFAGTVTHPFDRQRQLNGEFAVELPFARLLAELPTSDLTREMTVSGLLPIAGRIEGGGKGLKFAIDSRMSGVNISFGEKFGRPIPLAGTLALAGMLTAEQVEIAQARLQIPAVDLRGKGRIERQGSRRFDLALEWAGLDLAKLRPHVSLIDKIEARGVLDGNLALAGAGGQITRRTGTVRLRDTGLRPTKAIAPLSQINGRLRLAGERIDIEQLTANLGTSPLSIAGSLSATDLQADLHVRGKSIRADELIFSSDQRLRDVEGRLRIDGQGIEFAPATVRLDGGTEASVRGKVTFAPPAVDLDIEAPHGNIDEVIALWQKPSAAQPAARQEAHPGGEGIRVHIDARVGAGTLGELHFRQAEGEIFYHRNLLEIFPLRFQVGPGNCRGRVAVEFGEGPPLLKTSGHLEDVDAAAIYLQLLKRRGLITGTLRGDFYLEGRVGSDFLRTSVGGFHLETRDGVLRKFPILGKIFSLLNVSQILTLQLPDMAREGMPFQRLTGNFAMRQGVLSTEDLFVESPAMNLSLVGDLNLPAEKIDLTMGIKPLRTVDKIVTSIPLAGWLLAGEEKALITIHFHIHGHPDHAEVDAIPITSLSEKVFGIFRRVLNLPGKMIDDVGGLVREK